MLTRTPTAERIAFGERVELAGHEVASAMRVVRLDDLSSDAWARLAESAEEPNVFYTPEFAGAARQVFGSGVQAIAFRPERDELAGAVLGWLQRKRYGLPCRLFVGWTHPFAPLGVPLCAPGRADEVAAALLNWMQSDSTAPKLALFPMLPLDGPFARVLMREAEQGGARVRIFGQHARAALRPGNAAAAPLAAKKRKELRRQLRRLGDEAPVAFETADAPDQVAARLADFLRLEASGWKGRAGTATQHSPAISTFLTDAVTALAREGRAAVHTLRHGDTAIAAAITLRSGDVAWFWKIAYDEAYSRASPGVQLTTYLTDRLAADPTIRIVDSCATPDHPMIDHIWRDRIDIGDVLIAAPNAPALSFEALCAAESLVRGARQVVKDVRGRLLRR